MLLMSLLSNLLVFFLAMFIGSLPLGRYFIKKISGQDARDYSVYNLGVENVFYYIGPLVAIFSFALDILKGYLVVILLNSNTWAALGVFVGHLYPYSYYFLRNLYQNQTKSLNNYDLPRGRGNGVLLGILSAWVINSVLPWWIAALVFISYAIVLALSRYVSLASIAAMLALLISYFVFVNNDLAGIIIMLALMVIWRNKSSIGRILNKTEAKFGQPPAVFGRDPNKVLAAFMIHPMTMADIWQTPSMRWLEPIWNSKLPLKSFILKSLLKTKPQAMGLVKGIKLKDNRDLEVLLIGAPMLPEAIRSKKELATQKAIEAARIAKSHGAEAFGLGAFWSTVGEKGVKVQEAVPDINITNGGAYTAATVKAAVPGLLASFAKNGGELSSATAAVVGANGVVAFGVARSIANEVAKLILIGTDLARLERSAKTLRKKYPNTVIECSTDISQIKQADLIFSATSDPNPVIFAKDIKEDVWIFDLGRPEDVADEVKEMPNVHIIPGGMVKPPGNMVSEIDLHFGHDMIPACMAETMIMTATKSFDKASLGPITKTKNIDYYLRTGEELGFKIITDDENFEE